ncbi:hypothetical protein GOA67_29710 [Sinorhizobium meliloti]|uniref:hypothetical protein n=1 Tax=Rhizobium meliloti TaxID=382 RepID=UPI00299E0A4F|nr:hypothetical protein [Sinorhizobium meliloti]
MARPPPLFNREFALQHGSTQVPVPVDTLAVYFAQNVKILATSRARARDARLASTKNEAARTTVALVVTVQH